MASTSTLIHELLEAGAHFGHRTCRWNPKMDPYIYTHRNGIHIIDLKQTVQNLYNACRFVHNIAKGGGDVLFVGCKKQAKTVIRKSSLDSDSPFVCERWLGGTLTNYETICKSVDKLKNIEKMQEDGTIYDRPKREILKLKKLEQKLSLNLEGIRNIKKMPEALVVVDIQREQIAVKEARVLGIPVIGFVDTNADPDTVDLCVPVNDDALKATDLLLTVLVSAIKKGKNFYSQTIAEEKKVDNKHQAEIDRDLLKEKAAEIARQNREKEKSLLLEQEKISKKKNSALKNTPAKTLKEVAKKINEENSSGEALKKVTKSVKKTTEENSSAEALKKVTKSVKKTTEENSSAEALKKATKGAKKTTEENSSGESSKKITKGAKKTTEENSSAEASKKVTKRAKK